MADFIVNQHDGSEAAEDVTQRDEALSTEAPGICT